MSREQDRQIGEVVRKEGKRLSEFIRRRVPDASDAEDLVQEVFHELVEANRLLVPIEHVTGWLYRVARNRIIDLFRRRRPGRGRPVEAGDEDEASSLDDLLPSAAAGPEALLARRMLLDALVSAIDELPPEQREVFVAHEIEGRGFRELSEATGVGVNTLLSRKHYAVRRLRARLQDVYDDYREEGGF